MAPPNYGTAVPWNHGNVVSWIVVVNEDQNVDCQHDTKRNPNRWKATLQNDLNFALFYNVPSPRVDQALSILQQAEESLRALLAAAVNEGDYEGTVALASMGKALTQLLPAKPSSGAREQTLRQTRTQATPRSERMVMSTSARGAYPRFVRRGEQLVRIAWSRRKKKEYRHRVSYDALQALAIAFEEAGRDGRVFSTERLLPVRDLKGGSEIPNYQTYVALALLKHAGVVDQHGREGYSIARVADFQESVESLWRALPTE